MKVKLTIEKETKERIEKLARMNDTYDSFVKELLDHVNICDSFWCDRYE